MTWFNDYRMRLTLVGFVAAIILGNGEYIRADFTFGEHTNLGSPVNSVYSERTPCIASDGLELYFIDGPMDTPNHRPGGYGDFDMWVSTRATKDDPWGEPVNLGPLVNSSSREVCPNISADGLTLYFNSNRPGGYGGEVYGGMDIWVTTRPTVSDPWGTPTNLGPPVNSSSLEANPNISADGLSLFFKSNRSGGLGGMDIWLTTRETTDDDWGIPVNLGPNVNSPDHDYGPNISADGLLLTFASERPGGYGGSDMYATTRETIHDEWGPSMNLGPTLNDSYNLGGVSISTDGRFFFFNSSRPGGLGYSDIWQVPIIPIVDLNSDGIVDKADMCIMVDYWGTDEPSCDIGPMPWGDGVVDVEDLKVLSEHLFTYPGAVTYWKLDETEGMFAVDSIGGNDAIVIGGATWQPGSGQVDGALELDGVNGYAITSPVLNPADGPFSVLAWINGGAPGQVVVSQQNAANWLALDAEGNLITELRSSDQLAGPLFSETVITDGQWHRIGLVWDGSNRNLYVDGIVVAEDTQPGLEDSHMGLYIGTGKAVETGTYFSGLIDDVRIYNRVVSP